MPHVVFSVSRGQTWPVCETALDLDFQPTSQLAEQFEYSLHSPTLHSSAHKTGPMHWASSANGPHGAPPSRAGCNGRRTLHEQRHRLIDGSRKWRLQGMNHEQGPTLQSDIVATENVPITEAVSARK